MSSTLRDKILAAQDAKTVTVAVPEWGCSLQVRSLTTRERIEWEVSCSRKRKGTVTVDPFRLKSSLVVLTCYDEATGERVFTPDDIETLGRKNAGVVERLFTAAAELCGITDADEADILGK